jgi:hypothetical protein
MKSFVILLHIGISLCGHFLQQMIARMSAYYLVHVHGMRQRRLYLRSLSQLNPVSYEKGTADAE